MVSRVWSIALLALVGCMGNIAVPPSPPRTTQLGLAITSFALQNGLRVVLVKDPSATEIHVSTQYGVGAADDPPEHPGMAHLVEHLMFQQVLGAQSLFAHLESVASEFNAFTSLDATTYVTRADPVHLEKLLSIEAVRAGFRCATITESAFAREREVVINEIRQSDHTSEILDVVHRGLFVEGHPYRRTLRGTVDSVGAITFEQACAFADAYYAPNNAVVVISGDIQQQQIERALGKFLGRIAKRPVKPRVAVGEPRTRRVGIAAPIDDDSVLFAWPFPADPVRLTRLRAIAPAAASAIDEEVKGAVYSTELGDARAPMFGVVVVPAKGERVEDVLRGAKRALAELPRRLTDARATGVDELVFDNIQQSAIHRLYAELDEDTVRDMRLASYVLAGRDPSLALAGDFAGVRDMTWQNAAELVREYLGYDDASVVALEASEGKKHGRKIKMRSAVHDVGPRRVVPDPAEARKPARMDVSSVTGLKTRTLPNGMRVVLAPMTSVPTVDIRLVIGAGTADEPVGKRGAALVAAKALDWDLRYVNDLLKFFAAGGTDEVHVGFDHTTFAARGVDMHIDFLLAGLRRWVLEGTYDDAERVVEALRAETKKLDDEGALTDAWRAAVFGALHPYLHAGLPRHASGALSVRDAEAFRAAHYTPDNATLVITGRFDAVLTDQWIDYLFADWRGKVQAKTQSTRSQPQPASLAMVEDLVQMELRIALPSRAPRAHQLVIGEMLGQLVADVRHQLGASYGVQSYLVENRRAKHYEIGGWIDISRAAASLQLLRERIEKTVADRDIAARTFVSARDRVLARLRSIKGSAARLAALVERDVELGLPPLSGAETARAIRELTIDDVTSSLAELDLGRAVVMMRGPGEEVKAAFDVLGRTPTYVRIDQAAQDAADEPGAHSDPVRRASSRSTFDYDEIEPALTDGLTAAPRRLWFAVAPALVFPNIVASDSRIKPSCCSGFAISAQLGYRFDRSKTAGLHLAAGTASGSYTIDLSMQRYSMSLMPFDIAAFIRASAYDRLWGAVTLGMHLERITEPSTDTAPDTMVWDSALGIGVRGGIELLELGTHRLGVFGAAEGTLGTATGYGAMSVGLTYSR